MRRSRRDERGGASIMVLALVLALTAVAWGSGSVVAVVVAHRQAQNAADLAALAAAQGSVLAADQCANAAEVANANHARLASCDADGTVVTVEVTVTTTFGVRAELHARARAGPAP